MKLTKSFYFIGALLTLLTSQCALLADCPNQDVICCLEHNYPLGGPFARNQGTCTEWPSCQGLIPACFICKNEQDRLDAACHNAYPQYSSDLVTAELSQSCIPPHSQKEKTNLAIHKP